MVTELLERPATKVFFETCLICGHMKQDHDINSWGDVGECLVEGCDCPEYEEGKW